MKSIYLIGFMGVGKTSVGTLLSEKLKYPVFDLDEEVERKAGCSISELFETKGERYFRQLESEALLNAPQENAIISTGGGIILSSTNRDFLKKSKRVVQLKASAKTIGERLKNDQTRPLLKEKSLTEMEQLYLSRRAKYKEASTHQIATDEFSVSEVTTLILERLE